MARLIGEFRFHGELSQEQQKAFGDELADLMERYHVASILNVCWERDVWPGPAKVKTLIEKLKGKKR